MNGVTVTVTCVNCPGQALERRRTTGVQVTVGHHRRPSQHLRRDRRHADLGRQHDRHVEDRLAEFRRRARVRSSSRRRHSTRTPGKADLPARRPTSATCSHPVDDTPQSPTEFTWTDFGYDKTVPDETGNVNDYDLQDYLDGQADF